MSISEQTVSIDMPARQSPSERLSLRDVVQQQVLLLLDDSWELANTLTHGLGLLLSIVGGVFMLQLAVASNSGWLLFACSIYVSALIAVYGASTLSHAVADPHLKRLFRIWDQGVIYLLIAGTYTPFGLVYLRSGVWSLLLVVMWAVALWGFFSKIFWAHRLEQVSIVTCVILGWLPTLAIHPLAGLVEPGALWWMIGGGVSYTLGTLFLRYDHKAWVYHSIWHILVIGGSVCHYVAILQYVVLSGT